MPNLVKSTTHYEGTRGRNEVEASLDRWAGRRFEDETRSRLILCDQFVPHSRALHSFSEPENRLEDVPVEVVPGCRGTLDLCRRTRTEVKRSVFRAPLLKPQIPLGEVEVRHVAKPGSLYAESGRSGLQSGDGEVESCLEPARLGPSRAASTRGCQPGSGLGSLDQGPQGSDQRVNLDVPPGLAEAGEPEFVGLLGQWAISCFRSRRPEEACWRPPR